MAFAGASVYNNAATRAARRAVTTSPRSSSTGETTATIVPYGSVGSGDVHALFDAAFRQQLQGAAGLGPARHSLSAGRDRHPQGREPHAGIPRQESERPGAAAGSRAGPLSRRIQRHPLVHRRRHAARARGPHRPRGGAAVDVLRAAQSGAQSRRGLFLADPGQGRARVAAATRSRTGWRKAIARSA